MTALHGLTLAEQAEAVRRRTVSPTELTDHHLRRIGELNAALGAYRTVDAPGARQAARAAEARPAADPGGADLPPLLGVPLSVKDPNWNGPSRGTTTPRGSGR
ncbi:amidase family protein [Kitasatospora sp. NPDC101183]|uniref:amidase family protein n=1 Tax=Kitasatospora sp. NPDC101183 TaxID=3364100 RepID=UPI003804ED3A